jgi:cobalt ECF transporter T component CbiQ
MGHVIGYVISALVGVALVVLLVWLVGRWIGRKLPTPEVVSKARTRRVMGKDFLGNNISAFTGTMESMIGTEHLCRADGLLQPLDPRVKLITTFLFILIVGLARSLPILVVMLALVLCLALLSRVPPLFFLKRVLLFVPFTAVIAIPALFITPGEPLISLGRGIVTTQGARTAALLVLRVMDSISLGMLLILTTPWNSVLQGLRRLRVPALVVNILGMTYRYLFVLLHAVNSMFLARRSRLIAASSAAENRRWLGRSLAATMGKSQHLSEEVYLAMISRGYQGEARVLDNLRLGRRDLLWAAFAVTASTLLLWVNRL